MIEDGKCNAIEMGFGFILVIVIVVDIQVSNIIKQVMAQTFLS